MATDFVLDAAVEQAERVLAHRRWFTATEEQWSEFVRLLDAPLSVGATAKLDLLYARPSVFTED